MTSCVAPLICNKTLTTEIAGYMAALPGAMGYPGVNASASEDFATVAEAVPGCFMHLSAGFSDERGKWPAHNPKVLFNEEVLPTGAAAYAHCAAMWLQNHEVKP